ncbi:MAG: MFS transporter [Oscillochloris sp.]|nr:MFS transporter [Oscillochloris sp.]
MEPTFTSYEGSTVADYSRKWWALAAVGTGVLISTIDGSIVNISLNTLVEAFNTQLSTVEWVVLAYLLTLTCTLLLVGRLGDMFGKRRIYAAGFVIFTLASVLCGLAWNVGALIGFRVLQGIGASMIQAVGPALLVTAFPPKERGTALGAIGSFVAVGILIGPALGGVLLRYVSWQSIFLVNIPVGIAGIWLTLRNIPEDRASKGDQSFDIFGAFLLMIALVSLLLGLTEGPNWGWSDWRVLVLFVVSLIASACFVAWERHTQQPMINLNIFRSGAFSLNLLAGFVLFLGLAFNLLLTPLFFQLVYQFDLQTTGLLLMSLPLTLSLTSPISGRLSDRYGPRILTVVGLICIALGMFGVSLTRSTTPVAQMVVFLMVLGAGVGLFQSPNNSTVLGNAPPEALGVASGLLAVVRTLGQTGGIAVAGAIWASNIIAINGAPISPVTTAAPEVLAGGYDVAMRVAATIALFAIIPSIAGGRAATNTGQQPAVGQAD